MDANLQVKLFTDFPTLYKESTLASGQTRMCDGFSCANGWYQIIYKLSQDITNICRKRKKKIPTVVQVKEKFGTLRFYINYTTLDKSLVKVISELVTKAEKETETTCEICTKSAKLVNLTRFWVKTICSDCEKKYECIKDNI